ncbi:MAG: hypothetical protein EXS55_02630 [Candidatus Magasanikbacteria bacterium]|nr:hypothetical protein [Candidatus Magasanikbacteria bacterium]
MSHMKKLFLIITLLIAVLIFIFWQEIKRARSIVTNTTAEPLVSVASYPIPITTTTPLRGNPGAPLTLVAFIDLSDNPSKTLYKLLAKFVDANPADARLVFFDLPERTIFSGDHTAPQVAAGCAKEQNKFWQFTDVAATLAGSPNEAALMNIAQNLKLDVASWQRCLLAGKAESAVALGVSLANQLGVTKPPALFVNNKRINLNEKADLEKFFTNLITK